MEYISGSGKAFNTIHANDYSFYEHLHHIIDAEHIGMLDPERQGQKPTIIAPYEYFALSFESHLEKLSSSVYKPAKKNCTPNIPKRKQSPSD